MIALIIGIIALVGFLTCCVLSATGESEEDRLREDEEQMEYLRKWREEHERTERHHDRR